MWPLARFSSLHHFRSRLSLRRSLVEVNVRSVDLVLAAAGTCARRDARAVAAWATVVAVSLWSAMFGHVHGVGAAAVLAVVWPWTPQRRGLRDGEDRSGEGERTRLLAAAETSLDAFALLDVVRDEAGKITDFRIAYANANAEKLIGDGKAELSGKLLSAAQEQPIEGSLMTTLCGVVNGGVTARGEVEVENVAAEQASWIRYQIVRLGDGVAITFSNISEAKATEQKFKELAEFTSSIFENAPFSMFAADVDGVVTAMNRAAEKLSGYSREELVGKAPLTLLHDRKELADRAKELGLPLAMRMDGFEVLTAKAAKGGMEEQEWTLVRSDGVRIPVNAAVRALTNRAGEVTGYVSIEFDVTERRAMMDYVTHLATHDQLTGLVGRAVLQDRIVQAVERARRYGTKVAIFVLDLDQFKRINDLLGHWAGDQVLLETASRLRQAVRSSDTVARMGGDEFVVVMEDITSVADVEHCATTLVTRFAPEMSVEEHMLHVSASVGVCVYPDFAGDARSLLMWADAAMYAAKEGGRNQFQVFRQDMLKDKSDRLSMERALRKAIAQDELRLHYQPYVSLVSGAVVGMEALLRWEHPEMGLLMPAHFITLAEETGLILPLGEWAIRKACAEARQMCDELGLDLTLSVNLSPRQFQQKNLLEVMESALRESGLRAQSLEIEITENTLMVNSAATLAKLQKMRELGVRIAIDDFGTGFCNFNYLLEYAVDRLKIDQHFVRLAATEPNAAAVVRAIIAMSHGLNIKVIAEGVETEEQFRFLVRKRCDEAQGYFLAKPVPADRFCETVRTCGAMTMLRTA